MWTRVIELMEENIRKVSTGFELSEIIRNEFLGEEIRIPSKLPVTYIVPIVKSELKKNDYKSIAKKYNLSELTVRRYERWEMREDKLISPDGHTYFLNKTL